MPRLRGLLGSMIGMASPRCCCMCSRRLGWREGLFCPDCQSRMRFTDDVESPMDNATRWLVAGNADIERGASFVDFVPHTPFAGLIYDLKYRSRPDLAHDIGVFAARETLASGFFEGVDLLLPMPLHRLREEDRGYNQSREICYGLNSVCHVAVCDADVVQRMRNTPSQTTVAQERRLANLLGSFQVFRPEVLRGRHVMIVDDIITTGASVVACALELHNVPDVRVSFFTIGKTQSV